MSDQPTPASPRWLLLLYQMPTHPSNARVKTWRRLRQVGAIALRNSAYVLPSSAQAREDFEWMKAEIVAMRGQASVLEAVTVDGVTDDEIVSSSRAARAGDYKVVLGEIAALNRRIKPGARGASQLASSATRRAVRAVRDQLAAIVAIDFFQTPLRKEAEAALGRVESKLARVLTPPAQLGQPVVGPQDYRARTWVTRPNPGVDRMASAWLIRSFVDPEAVFTFADRPAAGQVPFDMFEGTFSHHGGLCTFEVLETAFQISDTAVRRIGEIVHALDLKDGRFRPPEAATVGALVDGLQGVHQDGSAALLAGIALFQALYRSMTAAMPARGRVQRAPTGKAEGRPRRGRAPVKRRA